jgi:molybdopterin-guanine dinucleotide biosynthesis protein A
MRTGAIILCGGKSSRMGRDKATLPFGAETMIQRVVRLVGEIVRAETTVVVASAAQVLPTLPPGTRIVRDEQAYRGPLAGLAIGFRALALGQHAPPDAIYASGCDVPLLLPAFVRRMFDLLDDFEAAVPVDGEHRHALAAVYRPAVLPAIERLLHLDRLRPRYLFDEIRTREVRCEMLRDVDPQLHSLGNVNTAEDYRAALTAAGLPIPMEN